ncbi:MAG: endonuclease III [Alphaproteobacteria bacterium]|jgi:endonuclease-3
MNREKVKAIFDILANSIKNPITELEFVNDFTLLVAIVLSAQSTDKGVNKATAKLFQIAKTPQEFLDLGLEGLKNHIKTIGLFNSKAKNIIKLCETLVQDYNGKVPNDFEKLVSLAGVGRKTANVWLNCVYKLPTMPVDTHVFRVANRIGLVKAKNVLQTEMQLLKIIPKEHLINAHHYLILHGRYTCKARKPDCKTCVIESYCEFNAKTC